MPAISIITPYWNTPAEYFDACVESVLTQPFDDFEWIIVDDGSEVEAAERLNVTAQSDSRIRIIHQNNSGVSAARNAGLDSMTGRFFTFLDPDDLVTSAFLMHAVNALDCSNADAAYGFLRRFSPDSAEDLGVCDGTMTILRETDVASWKRSLLAGERVSGIAELRRFAPHPVAPKVYRTTTIGSLRFNETVSFGEDTLFNVCALDAASSVVLCKEHWYDYRKHLVSATSTLDLSSRFHAFSAYRDEAERRNWNPSDVGMRYLHLIVDSILQYDGLSLKATLRAVREATQAQPKCLEAIRLSDYAISRQFAVLCRLLMSRHVRSAVLLLRAKSLLRSVPVRRSAT